MEPPFSPASARNSQPILSVIEPLFRPVAQVLEIGSGTGQHAVAFARAMPHLIWHTSDLAENHMGIEAWLERCPNPNLRAPVTLDVIHPPWPVTGVDAVFSANTAHIMSWLGVCAMFFGVGGLLPTGGVFCLYGPFNVAGRFTSDSNQDFDRTLRARWPHMGIRERDELVTLARHSGLTLEVDHGMPANNRLLVFRKQPL